MLPSIGVPILILGLNRHATGQFTQSQWRSPRVGDILDMDKGEIPFSIFIDLSKAFDTLDHKILINKLQYYGIKDTALDLFQSYLSNRRQYVQIGNNTSDTTAITTGVPQGSILGPQLFIIYINDIIKFSTIFHTIIYADDTTLVGKFRDFKICNGHSLSENINYEITKLTDWLNVNRLSLNTKKTKLMIFHTPQKKFDMPTIKINNTELEPQTHFNYLGITINKHTKWDGHVKKIAIKISKASGIIFKLNDVLPYNVLITLYNALILPHLTYGILAWGYDNDIIFKHQKRALRAVTSSRYSAHTGPLFINMKLLKVKDIHKLSQLKFFYKRFHRELPEYFNTMLTMKPIDIHDHSTRKRDTFLIERIYHSFAEKCIRNSILHIVNGVPHAIKDKVSTHSFHGFSQYVKYFLIENYIGTCHVEGCYICRRDIEIRLE